MRTTDGCRIEIALTKSSLDGSPPPERASGSGMDKWIQYRLEIFNRVHCPKRYQDTDETRLLPPSDIVLALKYPKDGRGVLLYGPTRTGKTRTAYRLARKWFINRDRLMKAYNGGSFARAVADEYGNGNASGFHALLNEVPILLLDDAFKTRLTPAVQDALYSIVEDRMAAMLPTILTMNSGTEDVEAAMASDLARPMIERLRESCAAYEFTERIV